MIKRIISRLDIKNNTLVKGINLEGLRVLGLPEKFATKYFEEDIDELILQDVVASLYKRNQLSDLTKKISKNIFIPITVGGGIRTLEDVKIALNSGADRVSINTAAVENPKFVEEAVAKFGSSTISIAIEVLELESGYKIFTESGRKETNVDFFDWIKELENMKVGEIIITSIKAEGRSKGLDIDLYKKISDKIKIPILAHGGLKNSEDALELFTQTNINGLVICSAFHFNYIENLKSDSEFKSSGNTIFMNNNLYDKYKTSINDLKIFLKNNKIDIR